MIKNTDTDCLFCTLQHNGSIIKEFAHCFAIFDKYPVSKGHILIISKDHVQDWFSADQQTIADIVSALSQLKQFLQDTYNPQGFNIGANCGNIAGQTINHFHVHLIPRYKGDCENPAGGVRGVIPEKQKY